MKNVSKLYDDLMWQKSNPSPRSKKRVDFERMVREIDAIVNNDWGFEIDLHLMANAKPFTEQEAKEMAVALMKIYSIAHCITCTTCQSEYPLPPKARGKK